jgi:hypothetical protein
LVEVRCPFTILTGVGLHRISHSAIQIVGKSTRLVSVRLS